MFEINQQLITEAIDYVTAMDLDDSSFTDAFNARVRVMNGAQSDDYWNSDSGYTLQ